MLIMMMVMMMFFILRLFYLFQIQKLIFSLLVSIFVVMIISQVMLMERCMLVSIVGSIVGKRILCIIVYFESWRMWVMLRQFCGICCIFFVVLIIIGQMEQIKMVQLEVGFVFWNSSRLIGSQVSGLIGCSRVISGLNMWVKNSEWLIKNFSGMFVSVVRLKFIVMCCREVSMFQLMFMLLGLF